MAMPLRKAQARLASTSLVALFPLSLGGIDLVVASPLCAPSLPAPALAQAQSAGAEAPGGAGALVSGPQESNKTHVLVLTNVFSDADLADPTVCARL